MRYMMLIYGTEETIMPSEAEQAANMAAYTAFAEEAQARQALLSGEALYPVSSATTVRLREGKVLTTDGPFAETKEQLGGYYLLKCKDLDEAITLAARIPAATDGSIEIRPVMEFEQNQPAES